ncbi:hypothetical protein ACI8AF_16780 [Blastococcus sp. SYSU D00669]
MPWALLAGLHQLIPCDYDISYQHHDYRHRRTLLMQGVELAGDRFGPVGPDPPTPEHPFWPLSWRGVCSWAQRTGDMSVVHSGDAYASDRERGADPMTDLLPGIHHEMVLTLPAPPGEARRILSRG